MLCQRMNERVVSSKSLLDSGASPGQVSEQEGGRCCDLLGAGVGSPYPGSKTHPRVLLLPPAASACLHSLIRVHAASPYLPPTWPDTTPVVTQSRVTWINKANRNPDLRPLHHGTSEGARSEQSQRDPELWGVIREEITGKGCPAEGRVDAKALSQELIWTVRAIAKSPTGLEQRKAQGWAGRVRPAQLLRGFEVALSRTRTPGGQNGRGKASSQRPMRRPGQSWKGGAPSLLPCGL